MDITKYSIEDLAQEISYWEKQINIAEEDLRAAKGTDTLRARARLDAMKITLNNHIEELSSR